MPIWTLQSWLVLQFCCQVAHAHRSNHAPIKISFSNSLGSNLSMTATLMFRNLDLWIRSLLWISEIHSVPPISQEAQIWTWRVYVWPHNGVALWANPFSSHVPLQRKQQGVFTKSICGACGYNPDADQRRNLHLSSFKETLGSSLCQRQQAVHCAWISA